MKMTFRLLLYVCFVAVFCGLANSSWANTVGTANPITVGTPTTDALTVVETVKYYQFTLSQPSYVAVEFQHASNGDGNGTWQTTVQSADGFTSYLTTNVPGTAIDTTKYVGLTAGTYLVQVTSSTHFSPINYTLTVTATPGNFEQEKNETIATANQLTLGTAFTGNLEALPSGSDQDYYKFSLSQPSYVAVNFKHASNGDGNGTWQTTVQSGDGLTSYLTMSSAGVTTDLTKNVGLPAGDYLVLVTQGSHYSDINYTLTVTATPGNYEQEKNETIASANQLTLGAAFTGNLENLPSGSDQDYYKFTLTQPSYVGINFKHANNGDGNGTWQSTVQSADGLTSYLTMSSAGVTTDLTKNVGLPAGDYLVLVTQGSHYSDINYTLTVSATPGNFEQEKNGTIATANQLTLGTAFTGNLETLPSGSDQDFYKFTLTQPSYVGINFKHANNGDGNGIWQTTVQSADGLTSYLTMSSAGVTTDLTKNVGLPAGNYLVLVTQGTHYSDMDYTLTVNGTPGNFEQEKNETIGSATPLTLGAAFTGNLETLPSGSDQDYYQFTLLQPGYVAVNFKHASNGDGNGTWLTTVQSADGLTDYLVTNITGVATDSTKYVGLPAGSYLVKVAQSTRYSDMDYILTVSSATGNFEQGRHASSATANPISLGIAYTGNIETLPSGSEPDYYKFTLSAPGYVGLDFKHASNGSSSTFWQTSLQSADGTSYFTMNSAGTVTDQSKYIGLPAGDYLVKVAPGTTSSDLNYVLTVTSATGNYEVENNDTVATANPIVLGTPIVGNIESATDLDYYKFTLAAPGYLKMNFKHESNGSVSNFWQISLQSASGQTNYFTMNSAGTVIDLSKYIGLPAGDYLVKVNSASLSSEDYALTVTSATGNYEVEYNDTVATANPITAGIPIIGNIESATDLDYYKFTLAQPGYLSLNLKHDSFNSVSNFWNATVQSADGQASFLTMNSAGTVTDLTKYVGLPAGSYLVKVAGVSLSSLDYTLTVNAATGNYEQENNDTVATANPIATGTPVIGNLETATDVDYYQVTLVQPGYLGVNLKHDSINSVSTFWKATVQSADGQASYLTMNSAGTVTDLTKSVGLPAGTYLVKVAAGSFSSLDYTLTLNATPGNYEKESNDAPATANPIALGTAYTGNLELLPSGTDLDYYTFTLAQAGYVALNFKHASISSLSSYWQATVQSADGQTSYLALNSIGTATDSTKYVGLAAGTYLVKVAAGAASSDIDYVLRVNTTPGSTYEVEQNDTTGTANSISFGTAYTGNIAALPSGKDLDYYRFTTVGQGSVALNFKHTSINSANSYWTAEVQSADGLTSFFTANYAGNATDVTKSINLPDGNFVVKVSQGQYSDDRDYTLTLSDTFTPTVSFGAPSYSNNLSVAVTLSATDNVGVTGFLISESSKAPAAADAGWVFPAPTSYSFVSAGVHTLYAYAKDASGNVSTAGVAPVTVVLALAVEIAGNGHGTIYSFPGDIVCIDGKPDGCSANFPNGRVVLTPSTSSDSSFDGWYGACSGSGPCSVLMDSGHTVGATFTLGAPVRIGDTLYPDLQKAYDAALDGDVIMMKEGVFTGSLTGNRDLHVIIIGGYKVDYSAVVGETTIEGNLTLQKGSVKVRGVNLK